MTNIGYTSDLINDKLVEIEIIKNNKNYYEMKLNERAHYNTNKYIIKNIFDLYGNKINDVEINITSDDIKNFGVILSFDKTNNIEINTLIDNIKNKEYITFVKIFQIALENLREKLFFNITLKYKILGKIKISDDLPEGCIIGDFYDLYMKKENTEINFSGIQNIYDNKGNLVTSFFHVNGIKEGEYKIYLNRSKTLILNFINDIQIGEIITITHY